MKEKNNNKEVCANIIIAEYQALRAELMYFIDAQRKTMGVMIGVAVGQISFLLTKNKINYELVVFIYLYLIPLLIFLLMLRSLECTSKILIVADYIHKGIKGQLSVFFDKDSHFFEWEEHKGNTSRLSRNILKYLDYSKWWIFGFGILLSFCFGVFFSLTHNKSNIDLQHIILAATLNIEWVLISIWASSAFNEVEGEACEKI